MVVNIVYTKNKVEELGSAHAYVSIVCDTEPPFTYVKSFPLARNVVRALGQLHTHLSSVLEIYNIEKDKCERRVKISLSEKPKPGLRLIVRALERAGIKVEVVLR